MRHHQPSGAAGAPPCSDRYYELERLPPRELERLLQRGTTPDFDTLAGWQFRGCNAPDFTRLLGIKKFIKGFEWRGGEAWGYNCKVRQNGIGAPWVGVPSDDAPRRHGFYRVAEVDPTGRDNTYLHALLLDYGRGRNPLHDPSRVLRDYLVRVDRDDDDLLLGKAYLALGPARVATSFFIIERHRRVG